MEGDTVNLSSPGEKMEPESPTTNSNDVEEKPITDPDCLRSNHIYIVDNLKIEDVYPSLQRSERLNRIEIEKIEKKESNKDKVRELLDILKKRSEFTAFNHFIKIVAGTNPDVFHTLVGRKPSENEAEFCIKGCLDNLREDIKDKGHCTDRPFDEKINLDHEHIQLSVVTNSDEENKSNNSNNLLPHAYQTYIGGLNTGIQAKQILNVAGNQRPKILIQGRAGVGKTTTFQWFGRQWALREWAIQFTMIFLLQLRYFINSDRQMSALDLLTKCGLFKFKSHLDVEICKSWLKTHANKVLLLLDGIDEISGFAAKMRTAQEIKDITQKASPIDLCVNILRGNLFPGMTIICSSRPFTGLGELKGFARFEMLGLTEIGVGKYVQKRHPTDCKNIMSVLVRIPILMSLCSITFFCSLITSLLSENIDLEEEDIKTYTRLIAFIIVRHVSRLPDSWPFVVEVNAYFSKLAHLAYKGIFNPGQPFSKLVFNESDIAEVKLNPADLKLIKPLGLLPMRKYENRGDKSITAEFMHLSIQELLAVAYHLSDRFVTSDVFAEIFSGGQFDMALTYLFGLYFDKKSIWIKKILDATGYKHNESMKQKIYEFLQLMVNSPGIDDSFKVKLCQLAHESQVDSHAKYVAPVVVKKHSLVLQQVPLTALDLKAINFVCQWEEIATLVLRKIEADDTLVRVLSSSFLKKHGDKLKNLDLSINAIGADGARCLAGAMSSNQSLLTFGIFNNNLHEEGAKAIAKMLRNKENLEVLNIANNSIGTQGAKALAEVLTTKKKFQGLNISANNIQGGEAIVDIVQGSTCLKRLILADNNIGDTGLTDLQKCLKTTEVPLQVLNLAFNNISSNGAEEIKRILLANKNITGLNLSGNRLGVSGAITLSSGSTIGSLQYMDISDNNISIKGASALSHALRENQMMAFLDLSFNNIEHKGATAVALMLKENKAITGLDLKGNNIGLHGAIELAEALKLNTGLQKLIISGNDTGVFGHEAIINAAKERNIEVVSGLINVDREQLKIAAIFGRSPMQATATLQGRMNLSINLQHVGLNVQYC